MNSNRFFCFSLFLLICIFSAINLNAQVKKVCIKVLEIEGNKKTQRLAVCRYMNIAEGDSLDLEELMPKLSENQQLIMNSRLFLNAELKVVEWEEADVIIRLEVKEAWYFIPAPIFELADRNFNVWWNDFDHDIHRVNLGLAVYWRNMLGYNDMLKLVAKTGFTRKLELEYFLPPLDKKQRFGYGINVLYSDNKEFSYDTRENRLLFYKNLETKDRQYTRLRTSALLRYRQSVFSQHSFELYYMRLAISDSMAQFNPDFFLEGKKIQKSLTFDYEYKKDKRDIQAYPLSGHFISLKFRKRGLWVDKDINQLWLTGRLELYKKLSDRWSAGLLSEGRYSVIRSKQPYWQQEALGYLDHFVRGYQYYVINGQDYLLFRSDLNFKILDVKIPLFKESSFAYMRSLPLKLHMRYHIDYGYVWDKFYNLDNPLNNSHLIGLGIGMDLALYYYNLIITVEYSVNKLGEKGVYLRFKYDF